MDIVIYDEGAAEELNTREIARYLEEKLKKDNVEVRGSPFDRVPADAVENLAGKIACIKIQQINRRLSPEQETLYAEIEYEKRRILDRTRAFGVIYDGFHLVKVLNTVLPRDEYGAGFIHIIFTNRLFATWDDQNRRYHLRTSIYAMPSIISTTGLIEAPARTREYYLLKQEYERLGRDPAELNNKFRDRFLDYGDERLTEVARGYAMQAVFYHLTGDPFCEDRGCRLYNAHWQEELIFAQLKSDYEFCPRHAEFLRKARQVQNVKP
ncbi:MAG: hypothetical protein A2144_13180 [Chloroflexi bacterium RBG_16_50_9]|nr:MAG: hypothetical protein A2144_13180 [Chloroflexi bacterium RBG_16_50_9]